MKKYLLAIGLVAFLMTSCCDKQEEKATCEHNCKDKKEQCDKHHHECDHHGEMPGMCPKMMAATDMVIESVANWENLDEAQKADVIATAKALSEHKAAMKAEMEKCDHHKGECKEHKGECKHHEGGCKHEEGNQCEGQHEGCQHQHEGCNHGE